MPSAPHRTEIQMRFADTDALGHVNNASFAAYAEVARLDFLRRLGKSVQSLILATLYIDFRRQVALDERVHVDSWIEKLGRTSFTILQRVYANDERAADIRSVVVHFDYAANGAIPLDAEIRAALEPFIHAVGVSAKQ